VCELGQFLLEKRTAGFEPAFLHLSQGSDISSQIIQIKYHKKLIPQIIGLGQSGLSSRPVCLVIWSIQSSGLTCHMVWSV